MLLFIVTRDDPALYERLRHEFTDERGVEIVVDRRLRERRRLEHPQPEDRRKGDRRARAEVDAHLRAVGWAIVRKGEPAG